MNRFRIIKAIYIFCLLMSQTIYAQYDGVRFGLKASPALAWIKPETKGMLSGNTKLDFSYGLVAEFPFTGNAAFATGFEVMNAGGTIRYTDLNQLPYYLDESDTFRLTSRKFNLRYVNIPISLKFKTNEMGYSMFYGQFGFDAGFRIKSFANDHGQFDISKQTTNKNLDISDDINFIRLALNIGVGIEYYVSGNTHVFAGVNFNNGFTNILQKPSYQLKNENNEKLSQSGINNFVGFNVGILF